MQADWATGSRWLSNQANQLGPGSESASRLLSCTPLVVISLTRTSTIDVSIPNLMIARSCVYWTVATPVSWFNITTKANVHNQLSNTTPPAANVDNRSVLSLPAFVDKVHSGYGTKVGFQNMSPEYRMTICSRDTCITDAIMLKVCGRAAIGNGLYSVLNIPYRPYHIHVLHHFHRCR